MKKIRFVSSIGTSRQPGAPLRKNIPEVRQSTGAVVSYSRTRNALSRRFAVLLLTVRFASFGSKSESSQIRVQSSVRLVGKDFPSMPSRQRRGTICLPRSMSTEPKAVGLPSSTPDGSALESLELSRRGLVCDDRKHQDMVGSLQWASGS